MPAYLYAWRLGEAYAKATSSKDGDTEAFARSDDKVSKSSSNPKADVEKHVSEARVSDTKPSSE